MMHRVWCAAALTTAFASIVPQVGAHSAFKDALQKKYEFKSVSCNACHEKGKPKTARNDFGKAFEPALMELKFDGMTLTEKFESVKDDEAAKKEFEKVMAESFLKVLEDVVTKESPSGETWGALLEAGNIDGIKKQ